MYANLPSKPGIALVPIITHRGAYGQAQGVIGGLALVVIGYAVPGGSTHRSTHGYK